MKLPPIDALYLSHGPSVLRRARAILRDEAEAQEVLQDVFTTLLHKPEQFKAQGSLMAFLYGVTTHAALAKLRRARTRQRLLDAHLPEQVVMPHAEARVELQRLLATLPLELAQLAVYVYVDELTHDEIAKLLNCSRQRVTKLVAKIRSHQEAEP